MSDLGNANWSETAASNNASPPDGWPEGMNPSDVNNAARENMADIKRFWNRLNVVKTTGGTSTAYTLTYDVAAASYYNGEKFSFIVNATCGAAPTLNINGLGAQNIRKFSGGAFTTLSAGDIVANQPLEVYYNLAATTFDIIVQTPSTVWQALGTSTPAGAATVDFTSISASINTLAIHFNLTPSTNGANLLMRLYNSGGSPDVGAHYAYTTFTASTSPSTVNVGLSAQSSFLIASSISSTGGCTGMLTIPAIQLSLTGYSGTLSYGDSGGVLTGTSFIGGQTSAAGPVTGVRFLMSGGNLTGRVTLLGTTN